MNGARTVFGRLAACILAVLFLGACDRSAVNEPGVVARVNGEPIRAVDLEARHDLRRLGVPVVDNPTVARLRGEYGTELADMIVARLVRQELSRLHRSVSAAEKADAEREVLADYPAGAFERMLVEEHIDRDRWREILADRLALEKFTRDVLGQDVRVGVSEAANYYKEHIEAFTTPARVRLELVVGREAESVKAALAAYRKAGQLAALDNLPGIEAREITLPVKNLPAAWREGVKPLAPGEATATMTSGRETTALVLLERQGETVLDPAKAYARVEAILLRDKLAKAFDAWLAEALAGAKISVSSRLVAQSTGENVGNASPKAEVTVAEEVPVVPAVEAVRPPKAMEKTEQSLRDAASSDDTAPGGDSDTRTAPATPSQNTPPVATAATERQAPGAGTDATVTPPSVPMSAAPTDAGPAAGEGASAQEKSPALNATAVAPAAASVAPAQTPVDTPTAEPSAPVKDKKPGEKGGEVEFLAVKASWILYTVDGGAEERVYIKPGKPHKIVYGQKLSVRLGSPSEVAYRYGGKETTVEVGKKESRILEFP